MSDETTQNVLDVPENKEIERSFAVIDDSWKAFEDKERPAESIEQGYINTGDCTVRIRISKDAVTGKKEHAELTFKSKSNTAGGANERDEWNIPIKKGMARAMMDILCQRSISNGSSQDTTAPYVIKKTRHYLDMNDIHRRQLGLTKTQRDAMRDQNQWTVDIFDEQQPNGKKFPPNFATVEIEQKNGGRPVTNINPDLYPFIHSKLELTTWPGRPFSSRRLADPNTSSQEAIEELIRIRDSLPPRTFIQTDAERRREI